MSSKCLPVAQRPLEAPLPLLLHLLDLPHQMVVSSALCPQGLCTCWSLCLESFSPAHLKAVSHPLQAFLQISPSQCDLLQPPFRKMSMPPVPLYNILPCFAFFHSSYYFITFNMIDLAGVLLSVSLDQNILEDFSLLLFMT